MTDITACASVNGMMCGSKEILQKRRDGNYICVDGLYPALLIAGGGIKCGATKTYTTKHARRRKQLWPI